MAALHLFQTSKVNPAVNLKQTAFLAALSSCSDEWCMSQSVLQHSAITTVAYLWTGMNPTDTT